MTEVDTGQVRRIVTQAIRAALPAGTGSGHPPAAGLAAAQTVVQIAEQEVYGYIRGLRAEGTSWSEAADLLHIPWSDDYSRVERAYELVLGPEPEDRNRFAYARNVYWRCGGPGGCDAYITDHGPYNGHPDDNETGHAEGCRRHAAEGVAYLREQELREERDRAADAAMDQVRDPFGQATVRRARWVLAHGGKYQGWSTGEAVAVALVLGHDDQLKAHGFTRDTALDRVFPNESDWAGAGVWLALVRTAATGETA